MKGVVLDEGLMREIVDLFITKHNQRSLAIKTKDLLSKLSARCLPQTFRDILGEIRRTGATGNGFIVSDVNIGYWYTEDKDELYEFLQKQLNRMSNQYANIELLHKSLKELNRQPIKAQQIQINFGFDVPQHQTLNQ